MFGQRRGGGCFSRLFLHDPFHFYGDLSIVEDLCINELNRKAVEKSGSFGHVTLETNMQVGLILIQRFQLECHLNDPHWTAVLFDKVSPRLISDSGE